MRLEIHYAEEWAALYVDGQLEQVGDTHNTEERAFELLGVELTTDDAFMRGQNQHDGVARTLDEVAAYRVERENCRARAQQLRDEADELMRQASRLDAAYGR